MAAQRSKTQRSTASTLSKRSAKSKRPAKTKKYPADQVAVPELNRLLDAALMRIAATRYPNVEISLHDALRSDDPNIWLGALNDLHSLTEGIGAAVRRDNRFPSEGVRQLRTGLTGAMGFYPARIDDLLLRRAVMYGSSDRAIQWLQRVLNGANATGNLILALWGVSVDKPIKLTSGISLVPVDRLPESDSKRLITESIHSRKRITVSALDMAPPDSALVAKQNYGDVVFDPIHHQPDETGNLAVRTLLDEIALVLTLVGPRASIPIMLWFTYDDPDFEMGSPRLHPFTEIMPMSTTDTPKLDAAEASSIVRAYLKLPTKERDQIRVAIQRINLALRRNNVGDRAVEVATAFEALVGDSATTEMTHKVKVRTVRVIGGTSEQRKLNADIVNKTYGIRSKLVHTGKVDENKSETVGETRLAVREIVDRAISLCAQLTKIFIRKGKIPTWHEFDIMG